MPKFRSRLREIVAEQFMPETLPLPFADKGACCLGPDGWYVVTIHGQETRIVDGDWIIPEPDGEHFYPCKPEVFETTYEAVE